jgi:hypothetical protein
MVSLIFAMPVILGAALIVAAIWEYMYWHVRFDKWRLGVGTSRGTVKRQGDVGPKLAYEFVVDGVTHTGLSSHMRDVLPEKGRRIAVYYDPADPARSDWYDTGMHLFFVYGVAAIGAMLLWMAL